MTYKKAILIHAYAIPLGIALLIALVVLVVPSKFRSSQADRLADYAAFSNLSVQAVAIEQKVAQNKPIMEVWRRDLQGEFNSVLNQLVQSRLEALDGKQLEQEIIGARPDGGSGLSIPGGQPALRTKLQFRGGYEAMQDTMLVIESKLPQMQLEAMALSEDANGDGLRYDFTYTVWESNQNDRK
jgi:hypothetical protein